MAKKQGQVEKTLRAAKAWINSPERLVKNWINLHEFDEDGEICRACLIGALTVNHRLPHGYAKAKDLIGALTVNHRLPHGYAKAKEILNDHIPPRFSYIKRHRLSTVHRIYDRAIAAAHEQGI